MNKPNVDEAPQVPQNEVLRVLQEGEVVTKELLVNGKCLNVSMKKCRGTSKKLKYLLN